MQSVQMRSARLKEEVREMDRLHLSNASLVLLLYNLGCLLRQEEDLHEAKQVLFRAMNLAEYHCGADSLIFAKIGEAVACCLKGGAHAEAIPILERSLDVKRKALGGKHFDLCSVLDMLVVAYTANGEIDKAQSSCEEAAAIAETTFGPSHWESTVRLERLARLLEKQGRYIEAAPLRLYAARSLEENGFCGDGLAMSWPGTPDAFTPSCASETTPDCASPSSSRSASLGSLNGHEEHLDFPLNLAKTAPPCCVTTPVLSCPPPKQFWCLPFEGKQYNMKLACVVALVVGIIAGEFLGFGGLLASQA